MLRDADREWVLNLRGEWREDPDKAGSVRHRDLRIRRKAIKALRDLAFLAENLDYKQHKQVFNKENVLPMIHKLMKFVDREVNNRDYSSLKLITYDDRLFKLFLEMGNYCIDYASQTITREFKDILRKPRYRVLRMYQDKNDFIRIAYARLVELEVEK